MGVEEKALGKRLQDARRRAGLTQQELCQKAGLSYSTLAKIERGAIRSPSVFTVAAIGATTGISVEDLLGIKRAEPTAETGRHTSKTGVKFVYFDLNGTLVRSYEKAFTKIAELTGLPIDRIEAYYWRYDPDVCTGRMDMVAFNQAMAENLGLKGFDWADYYLDVTEVIPGTKELVDWAAQHYHVGLLSGTMPGLIEGLGKRGKLDLSKFEVIVDSSQVKMDKTSTKIFEYAIKQAGYPSSQILLVDDDKLALVEANRIGFQISRFNSYDPAESIERVKKHLEF